MTAPLDPCPFGKKGRHDLAIVTNDQPDGPVLVVCTVCGTTKREAMVLPAPLDDLTADDIARITRRGGQ